MTEMEVFVRARSKPVRYHAYAQVSNESLNASVAIAEHVVLQPFECTILHAKLLADNLEPFIFRMFLSISTLQTGF